MKIGVANRSILIYSIGFAILATSNQASSATITLNAVSDGTQYRQVQPGFPTQSQVYSSDPTLTAKLDGQILPLGTTTFTYQFAMEFDLSTIPTTSSISSATLQWSEITDTLFSLNTHPLQGYVANGTVASSDFSVALTTVSLGQVANGSVDPLFSTNVTSFINDLHVSGNNYAGFRVTNDNPLSTPIVSGGTQLVVGEYKIHGGLDANAALHPQLILTVVPESGSLTMIALATTLIGATTLIRRRLNRAILNDSNII